MRVYSQVFACILAVFTAAACSNQEGFQQIGTSEVFLQEYNPHMLEVLWVVDDRSPMYKNRTSIVAEATHLFENIDSQLGEFGQYRMAIMNHDARTGKKGAIYPTEPLTRGQGTLAERVAAFQSVFPAFVNLMTDSISRGLENSLDALQRTFKTDARVPLVLIYVSYADDKSANPGAGTAVEYYSQQLLALKNNNPDLLRVYSINYTSGGGRCALQVGADIDSPATFQDRYFQLASTLGGETADLCSSGWGQSFDLSGVQLKVLPKKFALQGKPKVDTIEVTMSRNGVNMVVPHWTYDATTREIVFDTVPEQGVTIFVNYFPGGN